MIEMQDTADERTRLTAVREDIAQACRAVGRDAAEVTLVAVSKTFSADDIEPVIAAGQRVFGENRVQEAKAKWPGLRGRHGGIELHLIGPLQSNKAKEAVALFDAIHSLDRPSLAEALAKECARQGRSPLLFVEVNTGGEPQKAGVLPENTDSFLTVCRETYGLEISGLMCLPPADEAPAPHFALTAKIARRNGLPLLSMGMSADFPSRSPSAPPMCGSGRRFLGSGPDRRMDRPRTPERDGQLANLNSCSWVGPGQQAPQRSRPECHTSGCRPAVGTTDMDENGAAPPSHPRAGIVVELDNEIVQPIVAPKPVAWFTGRAPERPIVVPTGRILTPSKVREDPPNR